MSVKKVIREIPLSRKVYGGMTVGGVIFLFTTFVTQVHADKEHQRIDKEHARIYATINAVVEDQEKRRKELKEDLAQVLRDLKLEVREKK